VSVDSEEIAATLARAGVPERLSLAARARAYYELAKPNLSALVVITAVLGFYLANTGSSPLPWLSLIYLITGTALTAAGACALNMYIERDLDARMVRTRGRPIPSGRVAADHALAFSVIVFAWGWFQLLVFCGVLPALLSLVTALIYGFLYTPLKRRGPIAIWIGAIPGAIPPVMGWATVRGEIGMGGLALFAILAAWQFPHFLSLAFMYRDDYARGGFRFLPVDDADGKKTGRQIALGCLVLLPISLGPVALGLAGNVYLVGAVIAGLGFLYAGVRMMLTSTPQRARASFFASITYLPVLLALLVLDRIVLG
jgi:heme o synthase